MPALMPAFVSTHIWLKPHFPSSPMSLTILIPTSPGPLFKYELCWLSLVRFFPQELCPDSAADVYLVVILGVGFARFLFFLTARRVGSFARASFAPSCHARRSQLSVSPVGHSSLFAMICQRHHFLCAEPSFLRYSLFLKSPFAFHEGQGLIGALSLACMRVNGGLTPDPGLKGTFANPLTPCRDSCR